MDDGAPGRTLRGNAAFSLAGACKAGHGARMPRYRRDIVPGATYFITLCLADRRRRLLIEQIDLLGTVIRSVRAVQPFRLDALVVLPDHLHGVVTLPPGDADLAGRLRRIKSRFSRRQPPDEAISPSRYLRRERGIWQRRYWEHRIRDELDLLRHVDYIHYNPVKHGLVQRASDWPWSTFHRYVRRGWLPLDWGVPPVGVVAEPAIESVFARADPAVRPMKVG